VEHGSHEKHAPAGRRVALAATELRLASAAQRSAWARLWEILLSPAESPLQETADNSAREERAAVNQTATREENRDAARPPTVKS
jgi:hypothetical protein